MVENKKLFEKIYVKFPYLRECDDDTNIFQAGLNSIDIMKLVGILRKEGIQVNFSELVEKPIWKHWCEIFVSKSIPDQLTSNEKHTAAIEGQAFPLTDVQHAYWVGRKEHQILGGVGCHGYFEVDVEKIEPSLLEKAWYTIQIHHPMLRACFRNDGTQVVNQRPYDNKINIHNFTGLNLGKSEEKLQEIRERLSHRILDIEHGQVAGLELSILPDGSSRIHFDIDVLVADMHSVCIIFRDLATAYQGNKIHAPANWSFQNYIAEQNKPKNVEYDAAKLYWKERIKKIPSGPELPIISENVQSIPHFIRRQHFMDAEHWNRLKKTASTNNITPAMLLLTIYAEVLSRWSASNKFSINMPIFDRNGSNINDVVADFTDILLFSLDLTENESFGARAKTIQNKFHEDMRHTSYSGIQVIRDMVKMNPDNPIVAPVVFSCSYGMPLMDQEFCNLFGQPTYIITQTPQVWLDYQIYEINGGLMLAWDAVEKLFPDGMLNDMFSSNVDSLVALISKPELWESELDVMPSYQRKRRYIRNSIDYSLDKKCLHYDFFQLASSIPSNDAVHDSNSGKTYSYGELSDYAYRVANILQNNGVKIGDRIAVTISRGIDQIAAILGIEAAGACYVPVGINQPLSRREAILKKASIKLVLTNSITKNLVEFPSCCTVINIGDAAHSKPIKELVQVSADNLAYIIFTSGSTGEPKGVEISHSSAWNTVYDINTRNNVNQDDNILAVSSIDFDLSVYDIFGMLSVGASISLIPEKEYRNAAFWIDIIDKYNITMWNSVPILLDMLLTQTSDEEGRFPSLRHVFLSGDWIGMDLPKRLKLTAPNSHLVAMGGATEASIWSNYYNVTLPLPQEWTSIPYGYPLANQTYRIVDTKQRDCPDWVPGELWIGGAGVASGYCGDQIQTDKQFIEWENGRWYRTGDWGRFWPDDIIEFLGRKDQQIKIRGHRIELGEIENVFLAHPLVSDAIVDIRDNTSSSRQLIAFIVFKDKNEAHFINDLNIYAKDRLPSYMVPAQIVSISYIPITANGKLDRKKLSAHFFDEKNEKSNKENPVTSTEKQLAQLWSELLGFSVISKSDSYFEVGGDSLLATRLSNNIRNLFNVEFGLENIYLYPVLEDMANNIETLVQNGIHQTDIEIPSANFIVDKSSWYEPFPLTDIQYAYWIGRQGLYSLGNVSTHYYFELEAKDLNLERLNVAWQKLIEQQGMMRCVILNDGTGQVILENTPLYVINEYRLLHMDDKDVSDSLTSIRNEMSHQIFEIDQWPLFDLRVAFYGDKMARLFISFDNIVYDGQSILYLLSTWARLYNNPCLELPLLGISFRDYVNAKVEMTQSSKYINDRKYWLDRIELLPPAPALTLQKKDVDLQEQTFEHFEAVIDSCAWDKIKKCAALYNVSLPVILLTAYSEVLSSWSKSSHFTLNLTRFNRPQWHTQMDELVGDFTTLTLLEVNCKNGLTFEKRCKAMQKQLWSDLDHSSFCGVSVQREMTKRQHIIEMASMPVVFTSTLGLENSGRGNWLGKRIYSISQTPQVWLDHQVFEEDGNLVLVWDAVKNLFPDKMLDEMFATYSNMIMALSQSEALWSTVTPSLANVFDTTARDIANNTEHAISQETLVSLFEKSVLEYPDAVAIIEDSLQITYQELSEKVNTLCRRLIAIDNSPEKSIGLILPKCWEQIASALAIMKIGAAYLPINPSNSTERIVTLLDKGNVRCILSDSKSIETHCLPGRYQSISVDEEVCIENTHLVDDQSKYDGLAYVVYTSGSAGINKGVMVSHMGAVNTILDVNKKFDVSQKDCVFAASNMSYDLSVYDVFGLLAVGGTIVIPNKEQSRDTSYWIECIKTHSVTIWNTVPALMRMLINDISKSDSAMVNTLRLILLSKGWISTELSVAIKQHFKDALLVGLGGAAESPIWSNYYVIDEVDSTWKSIPYGKPLSNQKLHILNPNFENCPTWVSGKLYISGIGLSGGYLNDRSRTEENFIIHPTLGIRMYDTGNWGRYWPDGIIELLGKEDSQVEIHGYRAELDEAEYSLKMLAGIDEAAAIITKKNKQIFAFVTIDTHANDEFFDFLPDMTGISSFLMDAIHSTEYPYNPAVLVNDKYYCMMDQLSGHIIAKVLRAAGANWQKDNLITLSECMREFNFLPQYKHILERWFSFLIDDGFLIQYNTGYLCAQELDTFIEQSYTVIEPSLSGDMAAQIHEVPTILSLIRGTTNVLELYAEKNNTALFPEKLSTLVWEDKFYIAYLRKLMTNILALIPKGKLKVLEIGTRTQPIYGKIKDLLSEDNVNYTYADESTYFIEKFGEDNKQIETGKFDINNPFFTKELVSNSYHIVIANNTIHRSPNINIALEAIHDLLAPGGIFILLEPIKDSRAIYYSTIFFEDGFEKFTDERQGTNSPFLDSEKWKKILKNHGFDIQNTGHLPQREEIRQMMCIASIKKPKKVFSSQAVIEKLSEFIPSYMVPSEVIKVMEIPVLSNGEVDRNKLLKLILHETSENKDMPISENEIKIEHLWREILKCDPIGLDDNFFEIGGDSLQAIQLVNSLKKNYDIEFSLNDFFNKSTIREMVEIVSPFLTYGELVEGEL